MRSAAYGAPTACGPAGAHLLCAARLPRRGRLRRRNLVIDLRDLGRGEQEIAGELGSLLSADDD